MRRGLALLALAAAELVVVAAVLRLPDVGAALAFLGAGYPTGVTVAAACVLLIWVTLLGTTAMLAVRVLRHMAEGVGATRLLLALTVIAGIGLLGFGVVRHQSGSYLMCCGSIGQARQQLTEGP